MGLIINEIKIKYMLITIKLTVMQNLEREATLLYRLKISNI